MHVRGLDPVSNQDQFNCQRQFGSRGLTVT